MYEPIRSKSVHTPQPASPDVPHRTREEELDIRLAGHLTALLTVTDELRARLPEGAADGLDTLAQQLSAQVARLSGGRAPLRAAPTGGPADEARIETLRQRAHTLAGLALVVAESREDAEAAALTDTALSAYATPLLAAG